MFKKHFILYLYLLTKQDYCMKYPILIFITIFLASCANNNNLSYNTPIENENLEYFSFDHNTKIIGSIIDENSDLQLNVLFYVYHQDKVIYGSLCNENGFFEINNLNIGNYKIEFSNIGYEKKIIENINVTENNTIDLGEIILKKRKEEIKSIVVKKPIIYIYPEEKIEVNVKIEFKGELTHTYPKYTESGWQVTAFPDGKLVDLRGKEYYALFWEGNPTNKINPKNGNLVSGEQTVIFLENSLEVLGLNYKEANEFIMYWLPQLENNPYNFIHFSTDEYEESAKLEIKPKPETLIRIMMVVVPLSEPIDYEIQDISKLQKKRKGYTVVEWGGVVNNFLP